VRLLACVLFAAGVATLAGCAGRHPDTLPTEVDGGGTADGSGGSHPGADALDAPRDATAPDAGCVGAGGASKATGASCTCASDCQSGFCADGVCCDSACTNGGCKSCALPGTLGTCTSLPAATKPRDPSACPASAASTCGLDGFCDGAGSCRRYSSATMCRTGTCDGGAMVNAYACDGSGNCKPSPTVICAPYSCNPDTGLCYESCTVASQCATGQQCAAASCGKRMKGATCGSGDDCLSGFCADGVCCNVACQGGCVTCNQSDRKGTCWPIDPGAADPRGICKDQGPASCGNTGACDGFGGCSKYAPETQCIPPSCSGTRLNTPGTCDGIGTCLAPGLENCSPFLCTAGACTTRCTTNADCDTGHACVNGLCGAKLNGQTCASNAECTSNFCVDKVCCDTACTGSCRSCALASAPGKCTNIAAGTADPRAMCSDAGADKCATNGKCDGSGGCQKYAVGTICAAESCASSVYTPPSTCSATGQCVAPDALPCSPYVCNGTKCFNACTTMAQCLAPNSCLVSSCGKKSLGASCSNANECASNFCAQGFCCDTACTGSCLSCALSGTTGKCSNVPTGNVDPTGTCAVQISTTCGTNGRCEAGACQRFAKGTACKDSTCVVASALFTATSTCDGAGKCVTPNVMSCAPFQCGTNVCKNTCAINTDCVAPATCNNGSCGLKANGRVCTLGNECQTGFCAQGVCCNTACTGTCQSCSLTATLGACSPVANGATDPQGGCQSQGAATCANDGFCDGKGACRKFAANTQCVAPVCGGTTPATTPARTCDGLGVCRPAAAAIPCAPFACNGTAACKAACTVDTDCFGAGIICDPKTNLCGTKKRLGQTCSTTADCLTGNFCTNSVCCTTATCGGCQSCAVGGSAGSCAPVAPGTTPVPATFCVDQGTASCGTNGKCDGASGCQKYANGTTCSAQSCPALTSTLTSAGTCAAGVCTKATGTCNGNFLCDPTTNACKTTCTVDTDCVPPSTCQGTGATRNCAVKANGLACTSGPQCISGNCIDGVCCGSTSCPTCQACNLNGMGTCSAVASGPEPHARCVAAPPCGNVGGTCTAGACTQTAATVVCQVAACSTAGVFSAASHCSGTGGACPAPVTTDCTATGKICSTTAGCGACTADTQCSATSFCDIPSGTCAAKKATGACVLDKECTLGHCTDGACCNVATCPLCQACNVNTTGTCANVAPGSMDPHGGCAASPPCGNTGTCSGGACVVTAATVACGPPASCASNVSTAASHCSGTGGACPAAVVTDCTLTGLICTTGPCTTCTSNDQCGAGNFCNASGKCAVAGCTLDSQCPTTSFCQNPGAATGTCVAKKANGGACTADNQCTKGNCVDKICCNTACTDQGAMSCSTNGLCAADGSACQVYPAGTTCAATTCDLTDVTLMSAITMTCDGISACVPATKACPNLCDPLTGDCI
jgi:Dickkopf N-terminal cysteine-rich region